MDGQSSPLTVAVATRPHPAYDVNGDGWHVHCRDTFCRIVVIDGLGHGPDAAFATQRATEALDAAPNLSASEALQRCHDVLLGTRGAAMAVARISLATPDLTFGAVGNVEAQLWNGERVKRPMAHRGIIGRMLPRAREEQIPLPCDDWLLLLYSDGIRERFDLESLPEFIARDPQALADRILHDWSRNTDDATVVVVMPVRS